MLQNGIRRVREAIIAAGKLVSFVFALAYLAFTVAFVLVGSGALLLISIIARGYVLVYCWAWFVTPVFGLRPISTYEAVGLSIVTAILLPPKTGSTEEPRSTFWKAHPAAYGIWMTIAFLAAPFFALLLAWIWHTYFVNIDWPWERLP